MELPDGYVVIFDADRKGVKINVTEIELVRCKHCTHCFEIETTGASILMCKQNLDATKTVDGSEWCCWGKKDEE